MPELPEVETIRIGLEKLLKGKTFASVESLWHKSFPNTNKDENRHLIGSSVVSVSRRGKALIIGLSSDYALVIHLKMTGQLVFRSRDFSFGAGHPNDSLVGKLPDRSTRVIFEMKDGSRLFFNDQRKFGWVKLLPIVEIMNIDFFKKIGPEPLESEFTASKFIDRIKRRKSTSIKAALLDQTIVAGIGNIYADESLWMSRIHPSEKVVSVSDSRLKVLHKAIVDVLKLSIAHGGSTDRNYVAADGSKGSYLSFAKVFRRQGQQCVRCGSIIEKIRVAGRGTHICPKCQKL